MAKEKCNTCGKAFRSREALRQHQRATGHKEKEDRNTSGILKYPKVKLALGLGVLVLVVGALGLTILLKGSSSSEPAGDRPLLGTKAGLTSVKIGTSVGERAPEFHLTSIDGRQIAYDSGKPKVIYFMAAWCPTCIPEEQALAKLYQEYGDRVEIITVDIDTRTDTVADLQDFQRRYGDSWPHVLNWQMAGLFKVNRLDTTYILNRNNVITYTDGWSTTYETLEREVLKVLPSEEARPAKTEEPSPAEGAPKAQMEIATAQPTLGNPDAPVTIVEFADFQCPFCGAESGQNQDVIQYLRSRDPNWEPLEPNLEPYIESGKVKLIFLNFVFLGPESEWAAEAAECAHEQGRFWEYYEELFASQRGENEGAFVKENLKRFAAELGLDGKTFSECLDSGKFAEEVRNDTEEGQRLGVRGTPTFFINGRMLVGAQPFSKFKRIIDEELEKASEEQ